MDWGGLSEGSGFRARAGTLTLLLLASGDEPATVREVLARLDAEVFDPDLDPGTVVWEEDDEWWDGEDWEALERERPIPPVLKEDLRHPPGAEHRRLELHYAARVLGAWLSESPNGPTRVCDEEGKLAIATLATCWSSTVVHALAGAALTFEELEEATGAVSRKALKARVGALEDAGLVEPLEGPAGEVRYAATAWLRRGIAPLAAAARHECRLRSLKSATPDVLDVGAAFLLTLPLVELPADLSGACRLGVRMPRGGRPMPGAQLGMAGATAQVENGHVVSVDLELDPSPPSWATGSPLGWLDTVIDPRAEGVDVGFGTRLAEALIEGLHEALFGRLFPGAEEMRGR